VVPATAATYGGQQSLPRGLKEPETSAQRSPRSHQAGKCATVADQQNRICRHGDDIRCPRRHPRRSARPAARAIWAPHILRPRHPRRTGHRRRPLRCPHRHLHRLPRCLAPETALATSTPRVLGRLAQRRTQRRRRRHGNPETELPPWMEAGRLNCTVLPPPR